MQIEDTNQFRDAVLWLDDYAKRIGIDYAALMKACRNYYGVGTAMPIHGGPKCKEEPEMLAKMFAIVHSDWNDIIPKPGEFDNGSMFCDGEEDDYYDCGC